MAVSRRAARSTWLASQRHFSFAAVSSDTEGRGILQGPIFVDFGRNGLNITTAGDLVNNLTAGETSISATKNGEIQAIANGEAAGLANYNVNAKSEK